MSQRNAWNGPGSASNPASFAGPREEADDAPNTWVPAINTGDADGVPDRSWSQSGLHFTAEGI